MNETTGYIVEEPDNESLAGWRSFLGIRLQSDDNQDLLGNIVLRFISSYTALLYYRPRLIIMRLSNLTIHSKLVIQASVSSLRRHGVVRYVSGYNAG